MLINRHAHDLRWRITASLHQPRLSFLKPICSQQLKNFDSEKKRQKLMPKTLQVSCKVHPKIGAISYPRSDIGFDLVRSRINWKTRTLALYRTTWKIKTICELVACVFRRLRPWKRCAFSLSSDWLLEMHVLVLIGRLDKFASGF